MRQILSDNAYEAWTCAIRYCKDILAGKCTLQYQKAFISSLHNAVELYLKQIMLNETMHEVAKIPNNKSQEAINLKFQYNNCSNLNCFFSELSIKKLHYFKSISFTDLIKKINIDIFKRSDIQDTMKLLHCLRNDESHFFINEKTFLSEETFCKLHNFMIEFYELLRTWKPNDEKRKYNFFSLLPLKVDSDAQLYFSFARQALNKFSYDRAVRNSQLVKELARILSGDHLYGAPDFSSYFIAKEIVQLNSQYRNVFDDVWTYIYMMQSLGIIKIEEQFDEDNSIVNYKMIVNL